MYKFAIFHLANLGKFSTFYFLKLFTLCTVERY